MHFGSCHASVDPFLELDPLAGNLTRPEKCTAGSRLACCAKGGSCAVCLSITDACDLSRDAFDAVYGSSAGAINATYFLSGQRDGVSIYREDIANDRFVSLRRLVPRRGEQPQSACLFFLFF